MFRFLLAPILGLLIYFALRRAKRSTLIYCVLLAVTFIPTIPIFFTYLNYSSILLRDICIIVFFAIFVGSLIQRGIFQRVLASFLLLLILLKGPLFGIYFPGTYDLSDKVEVKNFDFESYSLILERIRQPPDPSNDIYEWKGKKYLLGGLLYKGMLISDSSLNNDKCIQTVYISRVDNYEKGATTLERMVDYDTCKNKIISIERHYR